jgi:hypothetical protein
VVDMLLMDMREIVDMEMEISLFANRVAPEF